MSGLVISFLKQFFIPLGFVALLLFITLFLIKKHPKTATLFVLICLVIVGVFGNPIFSTDTASALRALEIGADAMFKATMVDGVYDKDPHKYADAVRYDTLTFTRVLDERLAVMDSTAATLCRDNGLPILVFDLGQPANIAKAVKGESVGTLVRE